MPVETLRPSDGRLAGVPFTSAMPFRILNKGPDYFRRQAEPGARKLSAVERLEADKAKYVKSQQVALTRQAPIQPPIIRKPLSTGGRQGPGERRRPALNLDILNNLISDVCDGPSPGSQSSSSTSPSSSSPSSGAKTRAPRFGVPVPYSSPNSVTVRRVDVRPQAEIRKPQRGSARKHPSLHRSKSDLSDRYSRATADLERFFNYCGLDPEEVEGMGGVERFTRANSDIVSISKLRSVSTPSSECGDEADQVREDEDDEEDGPPRANERVPYGISVIERNARVIKWLYGIRQARDSNSAVSNV
uniref:Family with sequence similarity 110 member A n=1 Tax=Amphilophus citrinellus TaxID=61819 RepID=A0A3Q0RXV0_AMPCI